MLKTQIIAVIVSVSLQLVCLLTFSALSEGATAAPSPLWPLIGVSAGAVYVLFSMVAWITALLARERDTILFAKTAIITAVGVILNTIVALVNGLYLMGLSAF